MWSSWWRMFRKGKKRHSSSSSQSSEISTKSKVVNNTSMQTRASLRFIKAALSNVSVSLQSVDSSLGGLSRSSTVASLDTDSTKSSGQLDFLLKFWSSLAVYFSNWCFFCCCCFLSIGNNTSETCAEFRVKYVGAIEKLKFDMSKTLQEPLDLINYIDAAQVRSWRKIWAHFNFNLSPWKHAVIILI